MSGPSVRDHRGREIANVSASPALVEEFKFITMTARASATEGTVIDGVIRKTIGFDGALMSDDLNMQALSGTLAERAFASQQAGCDLALHCNGEYDDMVAVASGLEHASPATLRRLTRAMNWLAAPKPFDREAGVWERDALLARVGA